MEQVTGTNEALGTCLEMLRAYREAIVATQEEVQMWEGRIAQTGPGQALQAAKEKLAKLRASAQEIEGNVRDVALHAYQATGNKKPALGVGIRVYKKARYDETAMLGWCKANAPTFVIETVDGKAIDKIASDLKAKGAPVEIEETPTATIAKDLGEMQPIPEPLPDGEHGPEMGRL